MTRETIALGDRSIGAGQPCFVIAEAGCNHDGSLEKAYALIDVAADAQADAVKFQTFDADLLATEASPKAAYQLETTDAQESQHSMLRKLQLPYESFRPLADYARAKGLIFLSTPFDERSAEVVVRLGAPAIKVGSGELTHLPLLASLAGYGLPMLISTGMATLGDIEAALAVVREAGNGKIGLFHAVSCYPTQPGDVNLRAMDVMRQAFGVPIGYSDHTLGISIALAAVARGACMIEKHFTLDATALGPDHRASLEPPALKELVAQIRAIERSLGTGHKEPAAAELDTRRVARRSLAAARTLAVGDQIGLDDISVLRPGTGLAPSALHFVIGRHARTTIAAGTLLDWGLLA